MLRHLITIISSSVLLTIVPLPIVSQEIKLSLLAQQTPEVNLYDHAQSISVKVISGNNWGSGVIINKKGKNYTILTNRHVITPSDRHQIQTPDGKLYPASIQDNSNSGRNDLAILQFSSDQNYRVAILGNSGVLRRGEAVYAVGFPIIKEDYSERNNRGFVFTKGQVSLLLTQPLLEGYQLGYTNDVRKGMSGGAILNSQGQLIGINGKHAYPLWGDPFIYRDGSKPTPQLEKQMISMSWGIPSETFKPLLGKYYSRNISTPASTPPPKLESIYPLKKSPNPLAHPPEYLW